MHSYIALLVALSTTIVGLQNPYQRARNAFQKHNPNVHSSPDVQSPPNVHTLPSRIRPFPLEYWYAWRHRYLTPETESMQDDLFLSDSWANFSQNLLSTAPDCLMLTLTLGNPMPVYCPTVLQAIPVFFSGSSLQAIR